MVYFGGHVIDNPVLQVAPNLLKPNTVLTMHAVGYNRTSLDKMLPYVPFQDCAIDGWMGQHHNIIKYMAYPMAAIQRKSPTDLDANGYSPSVSDWEAAYGRINIAK